jgi:hypothetical protein
VTALADPPVRSAERSDERSDTTEPADRRWATAAAALATVVAALGVAALAGAFSGSGDGAEIARLEVQGVAHVDRADGSRQVVTDRLGLRAGDRVRVTDGTAHLRLDDGVAVELRAGSAGLDDSVVLVGEPPSLERGGALVTAGTGAGRVESAGTEIEVSGAAKVTRALGVGVAVYDGLATIDSAGQERVVPALRQLLVPALGRPPRTPLPVEYDAADPWDRRYLAGAMELGEQLEAMARGYTGNLAPGQGTTAAFYAELLPGLAGQEGYGQSLIDPVRPTGETLVGAAIADLGVRGSFVERWEATFGFRDQGAAWGLVALDQGVNRAPLLSAVELAVQGSPLDFAATPPTPGAPLPSETAPTAPPSEPVPPATAPPPTTAPPPPPSPTTTAPSVPGFPEPSPIDDLLGPIVEPTDDVVDTTQETTDSVTDLIGSLLQP